MIVAGFQPQQPSFDPNSGHVGFVVDKVELGQVFYKYFGFLASSYTTKCSTLNYHPGIVQQANY
jgi:Zn-dependent M28 family amino/carboxypeptidase